MSATVDPRVERTHQVVVRAAAELLAEEGIDRITIDAIAERSGVARSTIYRHWPDRAELFGQAFAVVCSVDGIPDHGTVVDDLRDKASSLARGLDGEAWGRMLPAVVGAADHDDDIRRALTDFAARRKAEAVALLERAVERGEIDGDQDFVGALERFIAPFFHRRLMTRDPIDGELVERQLRAVCAEVGAVYEPTG